jgi:hypothetical protein
VFVNLVDNNNLEVIDLEPTTVGGLRAHGIALLPGGTGGPGTGLTIQPGVIIVPDGVANVTVETVISRCQSTGFESCSGRSALRVLENVTAAVHDNVATVPLRTPNSNGFDDHGSVVRMTWLDAHGKVIKHTTTTYTIADTGSAPWPTSPK